MVPHQQYVDLYAALSLVQTNAQAVAAADKCIETVQAVRDHFGGWVTTAANFFTFGLYGVGNGDRQNAESELDAALADVRQYRDPLSGELRDSPVVASEWDNLSHAIGRAYNVMWSISDIEGSEGEWQNFIAWVGSTIADSIAALPGVIRAVTAYAGDVVGAAAGGVAGGVSGALWDLLEGAWPLLLAAGVVLGVGIYAVGPANAKKLARAAVI